MIYPNGILSSLKETKDDPKPVKRIELFAKEEDNGNTYGIIRTLFVAFSSERQMLELAEASNNVISVHVFPSHSSRGLVESGKPKLVEDKLVLKRAESDTERRSYGSTTPNLLVPPRWLELMALGRGARIIVSNPIENYEVPPPNIAELLHS